MILKWNFQASSGKFLNLWEVASELSHRLINIFVPDAQGRRPMYGGVEKLQNDPHWKEYISFFEYFNGNNGAGLGASHQAGWTALVAKLIQQQAEYKGFIKYRRSFMVRNIYPKKDYPKPCMPKMEHNKILKGQKALVTGASSGIGKAVALALGKAGASVLINYVVDDGTVDQMIKEIKSYGSQAIGFQADVSKEAQVKAMYEAMFKKFGTIDILVNNAGIQRDSPFDQMTLAQWQAVIDVNLTGQFLCAREAVKEFKRRGCGGICILCRRQNYLHEFCA